MNYWLANLTQLDELNMPLFDFVDRLIQNGKETARKNFGTRGSFLPHATDIWGQHGLELQLHIGVFPLVLEVGWPNIIGSTICLQKISIF